MPASITITHKISPLLWLNWFKTNTVTFWYQWKEIWWCANYCCCMISALNNKIQLPTVVQIHFNYIVTFGFALHCYYSRWINNRLCNTPPILNFCFYQISDQPCRHFSIMLAKLVHIVNKFLHVFHDFLQKQTPSIGCLQ